MSQAARVKRPDWLKIRLRTDQNFIKLRSMVSELNLNTVCTEARCPNIYECWNAGTATFMILGEICTRRCGFCSVHSGRPNPGVDAEEPQHVAEAVARLGIRHAVITSVDRDDLDDGGAQHFYDVINAIRERSPECAVASFQRDHPKKAYENVPWDELGRDVKRRQDSLARPARIHFIGFGVKEEHRREMRSLVRRNGGDYREY